MVYNFFRHFYFITKLTTISILFVTLVFLSYLFLKAYQNNQEAHNQNNLEDKINLLILSIENNSQELNSINKKIADNKRDLNKISNAFNTKILNNNIGKLPEKNTRINRRK